MIGPEAIKNFLKTIGGQCSIVRKAEGSVTVKCECNGDQTISRMNPYMEMNKLETKRLKHT